MVDSISRKIILIYCIILSLFCWSCHQTQENINLSNNSNNQEISDELIKTQKIETFEGKLLYKEITPVRSVRYYQGHEFFLITNPESLRGLILIPSEKVSHSQLVLFHNKEVKITAVYVTGTRPSPEKNPCTLDIDGQCLPQGDGYLLLSILLKD
ncbi:MAG: hypothetical protein F6K10_22400 [Moorea sp. SIO2B7]|nr:hypothetical protein [Moorena sp. SIO2B7]